MIERGNLARRQLSPSYKRLLDLVIQECKDNPDYDCKDNNTFRAKRQLAEGGTLYAGFEGENVIGWTCHKNNETRQLHEVGHVNIETGTAFEVHTITVEGLVIQSIFPDLGSTRKLPWPEEQYNLLDTQGIDRLVNRLRA